MKTKDYEKLVEIAEDLGFSVQRSDNEIELYYMPDSGEDFGFTINDIHDLKDAYDAVLEYWENFDAEEHTEMWLEAKRAGTKDIPSLRVLLKGSDEIESSLLLLSGRLHNEVMKSYVHHHINEMETL